MNLIQQQLVIKDWPLIKPGDEQFFGYVVAMGVMPNGWGDEDSIPYVDFAYNDSYERYRLPANDSLIDQLFQYLIENVNSPKDEGGMYGKVRITRLIKGYSVQLP